MEDDSALTRHQLLACLELGKALAAELDATRLLDTILHKVSALLPAEHWSLLLLDEATGELRFELSVDLEPSVIHHLRLRPGEGIAGQVALRQQPMMVTDVSTSPFFSTRVDQLTGFTTRAILCVPLLFGGRTLGVLEVVNPRDLDPGALHFLTIIADYVAIAVENTRRYHQIQTLALQDSVTGLYNTRYLYQALETLLAASAVTAAPFSLLFLDIDDFKRVVDTYGHLNGTQVLQEVAATILQCVSAPAFGVSYGGDEFVVVLPETPAAGALVIAERIRKAIEGHKFLQEQGLSARISASFGIASYPDHALTPEGLIQKADQAMYRVKERDKNGIEVAV